MLRDADGGDHRPDVAVLGADRRVRVIEIKADREQAEQEAASDAARRLAAACRTAGWQYEIHTPPEAAVLANLRWRRGCRPLRADVTELAPGLIAAAGDGAPLSELAARGEQWRTRPVLGRLLWEGRLRCDLGAPLDDHVIVTAAP